MGENKGVNGNGAGSNGEAAESNGSGSESNGACELEQKLQHCQTEGVSDEQSQECRPKRDIQKLLQECDRSAMGSNEEKCCSWHKYVFYSLPLAIYLPWLLKMGRCPPRCCPPRYCCPREKPICPPPKLSCPPKASDGPRQCPSEPDAPPRECLHDA